MTPEQQAHAAAIAALVSLRGQWPKDSTIRETIDRVEQTWEDIAYPVDRSPLPGVTQMRLIEALSPKELCEYRDELDAKIKSYDGGDRPQSPPARLLREWSAVGRRIAEMEARPT